jgi:exodeoxyribonuclease VII small subunit
MNQQLTFDTAFSQLKKLVDQIEDDEIQLDTLAEKVDEANALIQFCESKLRTIETETARQRE